MKEGNAQSTRSRGNRWSGKEITGKKPYRKKKKIGGGSVKSKLNECGHHVGEKRNEKK